MLQVASHHSTRLPPPTRGERPRDVASEQTVFARTMVTLPAALGATTHEAE